MIVGLAILGLLAAVLTSAIVRQNRGKQRLAESRDATRLAEHTLTALQAGQPPPAPPEGAVINISPLQSASDDTPAAT